MPSKCAAIALCSHGRKTAKKCVLCNPTYLRTIARYRIASTVIKRADREDVLGCTIEDFKSYLESHMQPGMTWANYGRGDGEWFLDYITPINTTKNKQIITQRLHYLNTQPTWGADLWSKGNTTTA